LLYTSREQGTGEQIDPLTLGEQHGNSRCGLEGRQIW